MSQLREIKEYIYENNLIEDLLEKMNCGHVKTEQGGNLYTASLPEGSNRRSVQIRNMATLPSKIRSKGVIGDVYSLVSYIVHDCKTQDEQMQDLHDAKNWIIDELGLHQFRGFGRKKSEKKDWNKWLHDIKKSRRRSVEVEENVILDESVKDQYIFMPWEKWLAEGISAETQMLFECAWDIQSKRFVTMIRDKDRNLIGVKGRATWDEEEYKYLYLYRMNKSINLYNLHRALPFIKEQKEVVLVEGYKSCMHMHQFGVYNSVSIEGDSISPQQAKLIKDLGIDVNVVVAMDKDKNLEHIKNQAKQLAPRNIYYIEDSYNLLDKKDAPVDKGIDVWNFLYSKKKWLSCF